MTWWQVILDAFHIVAWTGVTVLAFGVCWIGICEERSRG